MDDIKVFAKNEKELKSFIQTIRNFSEDIGMKFVYNWKKLNRETMERIELFNQE